MNDAHGVPGQRSNIIRHITVLIFITINKFLGCAFGARRRIMGAEKQAIAVLTAELDGFGRSPAVAAHNRFVPTQLMGLLHN